jgi:hypothetical protein
MTTQLIVKILQYEVLTSTWKSPKLDILHLVTIWCPFVLHCLPSLSNLDTLDGCEALTEKSGKNLERYKTCSPRLNNVLSLL